MPWKLAVGEVDGEPAVIILERGVDTWTPYSAVRLDVVGQRIERIVDSAHRSWMFRAAASVSVAEPS